MCLDPLIFLVVDRADAQILFDLFESLFDFSQDDILLPQFLRIARRQVRTQQIGSFSPSNPSQLVAVSAPHPIRTAR